MGFLPSTENAFELFLFFHMHPTFQGWRTWSNNI